MSLKIGLIKVNCAFEPLKEVTYSFDLNVETVQDSIMLNKTDKLIDKEVEKFRKELTQFMKEQNF